MPLVGMEIVNLNEHYSCIEGDEAWKQAHGHSQGYETIYDKM